MFLYFICMFLGYALIDYQPVEVAQQSIVLEFDELGLIINSCGVSKLLSNLTTNPLDLKGKDLVEAYLQMKNDTPRGCHTLENKKWYW